MGSGPGQRPSRNDEGRCKPIMPFYVYLLASRRHGTLYLGVTNDLLRRLQQHRNKVIPGFTAKYGVDRLVWFETYDDPTVAITREKALKKWRRDWKIRLIEEQNPEWRDLFSAMGT
jgi:putative endonuclease